MRYQDLFDGKAWRKYNGRGFPCRFREIVTEGTAKEIELKLAHVEIGTCATGRARVFAGYFLRVISDDGRMWLGEDDHSLRLALREVEAKMTVEGCGLDAIGLSPEWQESGLSANSGYGFYPDFDRAVHMLEPFPSNGVRDLP